jgi:hypothetical protein
VIGALFEPERQLLQDALGVSMRIIASGSVPPRCMGLRRPRRAHDRDAQRTAALWRARVRQILRRDLMDELQDTNPLQWQGGPDPREAGSMRLETSINPLLRVRHADPEVFRRYRRALEERQTPVDLLVENYRSRPEILDAVQRVFEGSPGIEPMKLEPRGEFVAENIPSVEVLAALGENSADGSELKPDCWRDEFGNWKASLYRPSQGAARGLLFGHSCSGSYGCLRRAAGQGFRRIPDSIRADQGPDFLRRAGKCDPAELPARAGETLATR